MMPNTVNSGCASRTSYGLCIPFFQPPPSGALCSTESGRAQAGQAEALVNHFYAQVSQAETLLGAEVIRGAAAGLGRGAAGEKPGRGGAGHSKARYAVQLAATQSFSGCRSPARSYCPSPPFPEPLHPTLRHPHPRPHPTSAPTSAPFPTHAPVVWCGVAWRGVAWGGWFNSYWHHMYHQPWDGQRDGKMGFSCTNKKTNAHPASTPPEMFTRGGGGSGWVP